MPEKNGANELELKGKNGTKKCDEKNNSERRNQRETIRRKMKTDDVDKWKRRKAGRQKKYRKVGTR